VDAANRTSKLGGAFSVAKILSRSLVVIIATRSGRRKSLPIRPIVPGKRRRMREATRSFWDSLKDPRISWTNRRARSLPASNEPWQAIPSSSFPYPSCPTEWTKSRVQLLRLCTDDVERWMIECCDNRGRGNERFFGSTCVPSSVRVNSSPHAREFPRGKSPVLQLNRFRDPANRFEIRATDLADVVFQYSTSFESIAAVWPKNLNRTGHGREAPAIETWADPSSSMLASAPKRCRSPREKRAPDDHSARSWSQCPTCETGDNRTSYPGPPSRAGCECGCRSSEEDAAKRVKPAYAESFGRGNRQRPMTNLEVREKPGGEPLH